jgi:hypothetical protein
LSVRRRQKGYSPVSLDLLDDRDPRLFVDLRDVPAYSNKKAIRNMDEEEYRKKYVNLRILKSIQDYLKPKGDSSTALYPIEIPEDFLYQAARLQGAESADELIHEIFELGLTLWSEKLYNDVFGSEENLEAFIELVKERNRE